MVADSATTDYVGDTSQSVRRLGDPVADISDQVDFLSNGFRYMSNDSRSNENADNYIYAAWAAAPIVASNNVISLGVTGQE